MKQLTPLRFGLCQFVIGVTCLAVPSIGIGPCGPGTTLGTISLSLGAICTFLGAIVVLGSLLGKAFTKISERRQGQT